MILGVTDRRPRRLIDRLRLRVGVEELEHEGHRVLVIRVPPRRAGLRIGVKGTYWIGVKGAIAWLAKDPARAPTRQVGPVGEE